jgi:hypothetical protein
MEKLVLKVFKACLDLLDQWVTKDLLANLAKTEFPVLLAILALGETQVPMVLLVSMDLLVLRDLLEREAHLAPLVLEGSKECQDHLENLANLEKMVWQDCLGNQV